MEYRKFDNVIVARIDKDEEISEQLRVIAIKENIKLASVQALGAINDFSIQDRRKEILFKQLPGVL